ncbi:MAG: NAD(P)/FAD-dependent oxidoreductase [Thermoprotei archaeon]
MIGGGPCGLLLARLFSLEGHQVIVFEEHKQIGLPRHCTGLVSENIFQAYGIGKGEAHVIQDFSAGELLFGSKKMQIGFKPKALVLDREEFELEMALKASLSGAELKVGQKVIYASKKDKGYALKTTDGFQVSEYLADLVVDCSGAKKGLSGLQYEVEGKGPRWPQVYFEEKMPREYFYWVVPEGENRYLVGTASRAKTKEKLGIFLSSSKLRNELNVRKVLRAFGGLVVVDPPSSEFSSAFDGVLVAGDAANQVKLTTGGGLIFSAVSARALASAFTSNQENNGFSNYAKWFYARKKEIYKYHFIRSLYLNLPTSLFEKAFGKRVQDYLYRHPLTYDDHSSFLREGALALGLDLVLQMLGLDE